MTPAVRYILGRLGVLAVMLAVVTPLPLDWPVKGLIALAASAVVSHYALARWRHELAVDLAVAMHERRRRKLR